MSIKFKIRINDGEIQNFAFKPNPTFGSVIVPVTLWFDVTRTKLIPEKVKIGSKTDFSFSSFTSALHYGQSIFEGMKAFKLENNKVGVYRLDDYAKRFKNSAKIMGMPEFDEEVFKTCIKKYLECIRNLVPKEEGHSLYLRPIMFAQDPIIKVSVSESYRFMIMASIVGPYFTSGKTGVKVYCNQGYTRAFPNGSGAAKTAANYALSLPHLQVANKLGYEQVLYLDSSEHKYIEELGGMNFFMIKDKEIYTPTLGGTILSGITRNSVLEVAKIFDYTVSEKKIAIDDILSHSDDYSLFASGTAATLVPILQIGYQANNEEAPKDYDFKDDGIIAKMREHILKTQYNKTSLSKKWLTVL